MTPPVKFPLRIIGPRPDDRIDIFDSLDRQVEIGELVKLLNAGEAYRIALAALAGLVKYGFFTGDEMTDEVVAWLEAAPIPTGLKIDEVMKAAIRPGAPPATPARTH